MKAAKFLYGIGEDINRLSDLAVQLREGIESLDGNYYVTSILEDCEWKVISTIDQNEFAKPQIYHMQSRFQR